MKGTLFGLVKEVLERQYGAGLWDSVLEACELNGNGVNCELNGNGVNMSDWEAGMDTPDLPVDLPSDALICWLGRNVVPQLAKTYPTLFHRHANLRSFVHSLSEGLPSADPVVEVEEVPALEFFESFDGDVMVTIQGAGPICALAEGVIAGAADYYGEPIVIDELKCVKRGDNRCVLQMTFAPQVVNAEWERRDSSFAAIGSA